MSARKPLKESQLDQFRQWIEHLKLKSKEIPVIIESEREKRVLEGLGIKNLICISKPFEQFAEKVGEKYKEVILLFDVDKRGLDLYAKIKSELELNGIKIDQRFRQFIYRLPLKRIEGILTYFRKHLIDTPRKEAPF